ncbi:probable WRKY transcription factor 62 [Setaria viridis]|uniref:WRKY domain-containing protein n=1 Tax=Setaria viridis TaxID=4556 RepID=A0A4U6THN0_SETVI|nr:probable WRKY transcription factor 62 isoform X1 [Setaria viridis]TKW00333.1 hypothetical protein SEVIR_8G101600v2 [Setaria viridis]
MKHNDSNRYLPKSSVCDDLPHACNHRLVLKEISKEQSLVMQLRAIVLPALEMNQNSELVSQMFQSILDCSSMVIAELLHCQSDAPAVDMLVDDKETVQRISNDVIEDSARPQHHHQNKRRRVAESMSFETPVPHYDGHQWRKYGQKQINGAKYPRSYYRCTYGKEQGCKATKTVQQYDPVTNTASDHSIMYKAIYYGRHTCNFNGNDSGISVPKDNGETNTHRNHDLVHYNNNQCSIVSVTCSHPDDHQTFLDGNVVHDTYGDIIPRNINMDWQLDTIESVQLDFDNWDWR